MASNGRSTSPFRGRFFDELTQPSSGKHPEGDRQKSGVDEANYRLLIQQLVLCNDEIERLQNVEVALEAENARLREELSKVKVSQKPSRVASLILQDPLPENGPADTAGHNASQSSQQDCQSYALNGHREEREPSLRPYLGVEVMDTGSEVIVKNILPGGGADEAGVQVNDVLVKWNGQPIASRHDFGVRVSQAEIGSVIKLLVERGPNHQSLTLRVEVKGAAGPKSSPAKAVKSQKHARKDAEMPHGTTQVRGLERLNSALN